MKSTAQGRFSKSGQFCTFVVFQLTPQHRWANYCKTHSGGLKALNDKKLVQALPKVKGRGQVRSFATELHTVITSVYIVWYDRNCSRSMSAALNTSALRYWIAVIAPPTGGCKCHVFTLLPSILKDINRDWPPLASTYMHETLHVHRTLMYK